MHLGARGADDAVGGFKFLVPQSSSGFPADRLTSTMIANAGAVIAGITSSLVTTERPTRNIGRWCGALPPILAAISGAMVLNTGVGEFADQLSDIDDLAEGGENRLDQSGNYVPWWPYAATMPRRCHRRGPRTATPAPDLRCGATVAAMS